ncbi:MAG: hypothetical protein ACKOFW_10800, partial [Planctomycetaceae bacterium]
QLRLLDLRGNTGLSEPDVERLRALANARDIQLLMGPLDPVPAAAVTLADCPPEGGEAPREWRRFLSTTLRD